MSCPSRVEVGGKRRKEMASESKRSRVDQASSRGTISSTTAKKAKVATSISSSAVPVAQTSGINLRIQQAKQYAIAQAQEDGCTGNFRIIDSPFGNFLVPVIPTRAELAG